MVAVNTGFANFAIIATGYDARSVGRARKDGARVNVNAALSLCDEEQILFAEHEHGRFAKEMHANNGRTGTYAARSVGERRNGDRRVAHVRRCSFRSPAEFYLPADCGR
jgi:hypothetical protein